MNNLGKHYAAKALAGVLGGLALGLSSAAFAVPFATGDVFAGGTGGQIFHYRAGVLLDTYNTTHSGEQTGMAFDSLGRLYTTNFQSGTMSRFDSVGALIDPTFVTNEPGNESIKFDNTGRMYIGQADGTRDILLRDATGVLLDNFDVATESRGSDWIELAGDNCTMYYTSEGTTIFRYDVCTDTQLTPFATGLPRVAFALRLLGDGNVLLADDADVKLVGPGVNNVIRTYDIAGVNGWFALNLDPDGQTFWSADIRGSRQIAQFNIATGALGLNFLAPTNVSGLVVSGEICQVGCEPPPPPGVPEPSTLLLAGLGATLLALFRRRKAA